MNPSNQLLVVSVLVCMLSVCWCKDRDSRSIITGMDDSWDRNNNRGYYNGLPSTFYTGPRYKTRGSGWPRRRSSYTGRRSSRLHPWQDDSYFGTQSKRNSLWDMLRTLQITSGHTYKPMRFGAGLGKK